MRRLAIYAALQAGVFLAPAAFLPIAAAALAYLGRRDGIRWARWARASWPALLVAASPALVGLPLSAFIDGRHAEALALWAPSLIRSARLALVFPAAAWLSAGMSPVMLRDALIRIMRPLGDRTAASLARAASLMLAFFPWTLAELRRANEAALLRGSDPRRRPARHLAALGVPVTVRALEKARRSAEALSLRDPGLDLGGSHAPSTHTERRPR